MGTGWLGLAVVAAALVGIYIWYATIVVRRNKVREALSSVDVHLNQRHDLIPNIVKLAARFMDHERALITDVTRLRQQVEGTTGTSAEEVSRRFGLEGELARKTGQLLVTMEAYPQLKSDSAVLEAQQTWTEIEAQVTAARRFYNAAVNQLNNAIQIFPGSLLAGLAGVSAMPFFEATEEARAAPSMDALMPPTQRAQP
jgi:LemA protein